MEERENGLYKQTGKRFYCEYERCELRFFDEETHREKLKNLPDWVDKSTVFRVLEKCYGNAYFGTASVADFPTYAEQIGLMAHTPESIIFSPACALNTLYADRFGAELWEVHENYKRRLI